MTKKIVLASWGLFLGFILIQCSVTQSFDNPLGPIPVPEDNEQDAAKIALGKEFFFDKDLSVDRTLNCAVCHKPGLAFTDGLKVSDGVLGRKSSRNSPTLLNTAYSPMLMFDGVIPSLEMQAVVPIQDHNEMGMNLKELIERLQAKPEYVEAARKIYNREMDIYVLTRSLAAFQRSLYTNDSRFDRYYYGKNESALSASEKRGWKLFSEKLYCTQCHSLPYFTTYKAENNGLAKNYTDPGRFRATHDSTDIGKFKVPTLRNIEITGPYMHDGSFESLEDVIEHYAKGGAGHVNQHPSIKSFPLSKRDKKDLVNFLYSLTDMSFFQRFAEQ